MFAELAYIFPDVLPKEATLFPLVQLFASLVYLTPAENDLPDCAALPYKELLHFQCPVLLGVNRQRFFRLLDELRQRPADYVALLLAGRGNRAPESQEDIISALRQQGHEESDMQERLWQARLLLKLGQFVEQEEEDIRLRLHRIRLREEELLHSLRDDYQDAAVPPSAAVQLPDSRRLLLLKAWQTLLACACEPLLTNIFVTADRDAFAAVMTESRAETNAVLTLPLPAVAAEGDAGAQRHHFRQAAAELISTLPTAVDQARWQKLLERHYPAAAHGRCLLSLHVVPGRLFGSCGAAGQETVVALLERQI
jgi:hypothetical protein